MSREQQSTAKTTRLSRIALTLLLPSRTRYDKLASNPPAAGSSGVGNRRASWSRKRR